LGKPEEEEDVVLKEPNIINLILAINSKGW